MHFSLLGLDKREKNPDGGHETIASDTITFARQWQIKSSAFASTQCGRRIQLTLRGAAVFKTVLATKKSVLLVGLVF